MDSVGKIWAFFVGKRTYLFSLAGAVIAFLIGIEVFTFADVPEYVWLFLGSATTAAIRAAIPS
jgi:hypothetical protein